MDKFRSLIFAGLLVNLFSGCELQTALDRVTVEFAPKSRALDVTLWLKRSASVSQGATLSAIAPWGALDLYPSGLNDEAAHLTLRISPQAFDDPRIWRLPVRQFTKLLPNGVSHGVGETLVALRDEDTSPSRPELVAYVDAYTDSAQWVGAAAYWPEGVVSPIPDHTAVWLPLKRDSEERVILSVAFYGAQGGLEAARNSAVAAVFADYQELGRSLGNTETRRIEVIHPNFKEMRPTPLP